MRVFVDDVWVARGGPTTGGLAVQVRALGVELVPIGQPVRPPVTKATRRRPRKGDEPVATGVMPTGGWR